MPYALRNSWIPGRASLRQFARNDVRIILRTLIAGHYCSWRLNGRFNFMDSITRKIADYAAGARFADITDEAIHAATQRLLDSLGCALGAYNCEPAEIGRRLATGQTAGKYPGRILCFGERIPAAAAS